jgi:hypothetical protein
MSQTSLTPPADKKRKLRKGATSCWECKRRKARCVLLKNDDKECVGCRNRDVVCVSQAEGDEMELREQGDVRISRTRLERVEAMLEDLTKEMKSKSRSKGGDEISDQDNTCEDAVLPKVLPPPVDLTTISTTLYSLLPSKEQAYSLCSSKNFIPCFFQQLLTRDYLFLSVSDSAPLTGTDVAQLPPPTAHPVLIAQKLLMYACLTQYHPETSHASHWAAEATRMATAAIDLVTTKDTLMLNAEGPECLMMEATWHVNNGDLRRALGAVRRAMLTAQLLGLHRPLHREYSRLDSTAPTFDPAYIWYRVVYADRLFCLILGLPQGSTDVSFTLSSATKDLSAEELLERTHCTIASHILSRNESSLSDDLTTTQAIDASILAATTLPLPPAWWSIPSFSHLTSHRDIFLATTRLVSQILHFNLLNQTHLPCLFKFSLPNDESLATAYAYSRSASTTATREILHRYIALQDSSLATHACNVVDFFALIAAITLLLLHLDDHWSSTCTSPDQQSSVLAHTRASDRDIIVRAKRFLTKPPVCNAPKILTALLAVEEEAYALRSVGDGRIVKWNEDERPYFEMRIPYFGSLRVNARKVCFERGVEIEELSSEMKRLDGEEKRDDKRGENRPVGEDLEVGGIDVGVGGMADAYGGVENAFLNSFEDFWDGSF